MAQPPKTPAPPRRKPAVRKTTRATPRKPAAPKAKANDAGAATTPKPAAVRKPAARTRATTATRVKAAASDAAKTVSTKATKAKDSAVKAASTAAHAVADSAPAQFVGDARDKMGDRNFFAALVGGVAAVGAAVAGIVLALREGNSGGSASRGGTKKK